MISGETMEIISNLLGLILVPITIILLVISGIFLFIFSTGIVLFALWIIIFSLFNGFIKTIKKIGKKK